MKRLIAYSLIVLLCGCSSTKSNGKWVCYGKKNVMAYDPITKTERATGTVIDDDCRWERPEDKEDNGFKWYHVLLFPVFILATASDTQRAVTSSPHYQAGGSAYKDYTQPQNQP